MSFVLFVFNQTEIIEKLSLAVKWLILSPDIKNPIGFVDFLIAETVPNALSSRHI